MNEFRVKATVPDPAVSLLLGHRLDLEELWRVRMRLWGEAGPRKPPPERVPPERVPPTVALDLCLLRDVTPDGAFLLYEDLAVLESRGWRVRLVRASDRIGWQLRRHPLGRFLVWDDELFTDPDLELEGFRPSRH